MECHDYMACGGGPSLRRCVEVDPNGIYKVCLEPSLQGGIGGLCEGGNKYHCEMVGSGIDFKCVAFLGGDYEFCTRPCSADPNDCPFPMDCEMVDGGADPVCGFPSWFGFMYECSSDPALCEDKFSGRYPRCQDGAFCTRECGAQEDCPQSAHCDTSATPPICVPN